MINNTYFCSILETSRKKTVNTTLIEKKESVIFMGKLRFYGAQQLC